MRNYTARLGAVFAAGLFTASQVYAGGVGVYRLADTNTPVFGGTGNYTYFDPPSTNRNALPGDPIEATFHARGSDGSDVVYYYEYIGPLFSPSTVRRVDQTSKMSSTESVGSIPTSTSAHAVTVASASGQTTGIFSDATNNGVLSKIAVSGDPSPRGGTFTSFGGVADVQNNIVFRSGTGIYQLQSGGLTTVSYTNDPFGQTYYGEPAIGGESGSSTLITAFQKGTAFDSDTMYVQVGTNALKAVKTVFADPDLDGGKLFSDPSVSSLGVFYSVHSSTVAPSVSGYLFSNPNGGSSAGTQNTVATTTNSCPGRVSECDIHFLRRRFRRRRFRSIALRLYGYDQQRIARYLPRRCIWNIDNVH